MTSLTGKTTEFPVEDGTKISDHFQANPMTAEIKGFVSESPSQAVLTIASNIASTVVGGRFKGLSSTYAAAATSAAAAYAASSGGEGKYQSAKFNELLSKRGTNDQEFPKRAMLGLAKLHAAGVPFRIRSFFGTDMYDNMVIESIRFPQVAKIGDSLEFTMQVKQIKTVKAFSRSKNEFRISDEVSASTTDQVNKGKKAADKAESSALFKAGSSLSKILGSTF
ncbi:MAG: hypothetical protein E2O82_03700 [Betaproteobacteria bacterium]|nr:MAG: hypothetical protein E2O82_03700 [Betaproteobacteria bacterium]